MCGIAGVHGWDKERAAQACARMNQVQEHRGPDDEGIWTETNGVALAHRRLSILDPTPAGHQPWLAENGDALVFNGEIYNFKELASELEQLGEHFKTDSDTEVLMSALKTWGMDALHRLNGMFAFAWWNAEQEELFIARDRMGIKPIYWAQVDDGVVFASEIRAILASGAVEKKLNRIAIVDFLRYGTVHAPDTLIEGVQLLPAGHWLCFQDADVRQKRWWSVGDEVAQVAPWENREQAVSVVREQLTNAVQLRMRSDVPLGAFLSGGIDSSAVVGLMQEVSERPISTFSVTFNEGEFDESPWSRLVAKRFGTDHHEIRLTSDHFLDQVPAALEAMDHPSGDGPNTFVVSEATKAAGITVALSGLGGDELFAGYPVFQRSRQLMDKRWLGSWPVGLRSLVGGVYAGLKGTVSARKQAAILAGDYFDLEHTYPLSRQLFLEDDLRRILKGSTKIHGNRVHGWLSEEIAPGTKGFDLPFYSKVSVAELGTYLGHTLLRDTDQMSMAHALEVRVPFLDHRLVATALSIPDSWKEPSSPKKLLTDALGALLPDGVINRQKMGFVLPWETWMRGPLKPLCEQGLNALHRLECLNGRELDGLWAAFLRGDKRVNCTRVWMLVTLGNWMNRHGIS